MKIGAGDPVQLPCDACSCWPTATVPDTEGGSVITGALATGGTTGVGAELVWLLPALLLAVTTASSVKPLSTPWMV